MCGTGAAADRYTCLSCLVDVRQKDWAGHLEGGLQGPGESIEDTSHSGKGYGKLSGCWPEVLG